MRVENKHVEKLKCSWPTHWWLVLSELHVTEFLRFWQKGSPSLENACYGPDVHSAYKYVPYTHPDMDECLSKNLNDLFLAFDS